MPPAKRAAKKAAAHLMEEPGKELRRAFEHSSRVEILQSLLSPAATEPLATIVALACAELEPGRSEDAAHLLRASEHLSFAMLASNHPDGARLAPELERAIEKQFRDLTRKAEERWSEQTSRPARLIPIYEGALESAGEAFERAAWHRALEFARAAEALSHVGAFEFPAGNGRRRPRQVHRGKMGLKLVAS